jgi:hypothetical protein
MLQHTRSNMRQSGMYHSICPSGKQHYTGSTRRNIMHSNGTSWALGQRHTTNTFPNGTPQHMDSSSTQQHRDRR